MWWLTVLLATVAVAERSWWQRLGARWHAASPSSSFVQRREPLSFFFSSFARRAVASGGDGEEVQRWRC